MHHPSLLGIYRIDSDHSVSAESLSQSLDLPLVDTPPEQVEPGQFLLQVEQQTLSLCFTGRGAPKPIAVDFIGGAAAHRRQFGGGKGQLIAKAVGIKGRFRPQVLDLTAGLGQDGFVLATLGCQVDLVERVPLIFHLLNNGLQRAAALGEGSVQEIVGRINLYRCEALAYLQDLNQGVDIIYLDPMFPKRDKKAQVNKSMVAFQHIVGADGDAGQLLRQALEKARYRVVVKRPRKAPAMDQQWPELSLPAPGLVIAGKSSRYDIYPLAKMPV